MTTDTVIENMVDRIVRRYHPAHVLLFGSHARCTADRWSDVILFVVMKQKANKRRGVVEIRRALSDLPVSKDVVVTLLEKIA